MNSEQIQQLAKALVPTLRDLFALQIDALRKEMQTEIGRAVGGIQFPEVKMSELPTFEVPQIDYKEVALYVKQVMDALPEQIPGQKGEPGIPGEQGKEGPAGKDGAAGADGMNGKDGADGKDGKDGAPGKDGERGMDGAPGKEGPAGKDGADGLPGAVGKEGPAGRDGAAGADGKDGISPDPEDVAKFFERRFSDVLLSFERRFNEAIEKAVDRIPKPADGRDGKDGVNGLDGFQLEDFTAELGDDDRTVNLSFKAGDITRTFSLTFPVPIDRGQWRADGPEEGGDYMKGDGVSHGGSFFIAKVDKPKGPPGTTGDFRLSAKRGRDGKDFRPSASTHDPQKGVKI